MFPPVPHRPPRDPVAPRFVDRGRGFLTVTEPEVLTWWDPRTGSRIRTLRCPLTAIDAVEISSDGRYLAVGGYAGCQVWDLSASAEQGHLLAHPNSVQSIRFSPDDHSLATGGAGRAAALWSLPDRSPIGSPIAHLSFVARVAYSPDGRFLATEQLDGLVRVWRLPAEDSPGQWLTDDTGVDAGRLGPDGRHVIAASHSKAENGLVGKTRVYDAGTGEPFGSYLEFAGILRDARLSPDGRSAATIAWLPGSGRGQLEFWEIGTGVRAMPPIPLPSEPIHLAYSPDGRHVAVFCRGGEIPVIGTKRGDVVVMATHQPTEQFDHPTFSHLGFSPDGLHLVTLGSDRSIQVTDPTTGRPDYPSLRLGSAGWYINFSCDGRHMAVGTADGRVRVWALATGRLECELPKHPDWVYMAVFSPDDRQILTACRDGEARLWDLDTRRLVCPPFKHSVEVLGVAFSPDGRHVATSSRDETIRVWEWHTGGPAMPPLRLGSLGTFTLAFTADGRHLVGSGREPATGLISFDTGELTAADTIDLDDICTLGELVSGTKLYNGDLAGLTTAEWLERWQEFHRHHPRLAVYTPSHEPERPRSSMKRILRGVAARREAHTQDTPYARGAKSFQSRDYKEAAAAFEEGVAAADPRCMDFLGYLYLEGLGTKRNPQTALKYFRKAAELGNDQACRNLGDLYFSGRDLDCDPALASTWWKKSTELGRDPRPAFALAQILYLGDGVKADNELAAKYWNLARKLGSENAMMKPVLDDAVVALSVLDAGRPAHPVAGKDLKTLAEQGHITARGTLKFFAMVEAETKTLVKDVPFIYQAHNFCGLASSTMLLRHQGVPKSQFDVARLRRHHKWGEGTSWDELVRVAGKLGKTWKIVTFPNTKDGFTKGKEAILAQLASGSPVIVDILEDETSRSAHSLVICGYDPAISEFLACNPALAFPGFQVFPEERLKIIWRSRGFIPWNFVLQRSMIMIDRGAK
jgi:WD40 repeat protein/TPR repeat protein